MKISFSTLGCPRWSWAEITATAHDLNYDGVEVRGVGKDISVPSVPDFSDENLQRTAAGLERLSLVIPCLDSDCCIHLPETAQRTDAEVQAYIRLAQKMRVPYVRLMAAAPVPQPMGDVDDGYVRDVTARLGEYAAARGVTLLLETHGVWSDSLRLRRLLDAVNSPAVAALWDIHHPFRYNGEPPKATVENLGAYIRHTHLKDSNHVGERCVYTLPGFGDVPIVDAVNALRRAGYEGFYSLEWVKRWDMTLEEPGIVFAHYAHFMHTL